MPFCLGLLAGLLTAALLWIGAIAGQLSNPTPTSSWVYHAYMLKQRLADTIATPKILIVSGSNALFGIASETLIDTYKRPVVNFAVNAALLLPYILYRSKTALHAGDIVLLPLEYPLYIYDGEPNGQLLDYMAARDPAFFQQLSIQEQARLLWAFPIERIWQGYHSSDTQPPVTSLYGIHNIAPSTGDQLNTSRSQRVDAVLREWEGLASKPPHTYGKDDRPDNLAWRYLRDYVAWARKRGVCLIFIPSSFMDRPSYHIDSIERAFYSGLPDKIRALGAAYVGSPFDYMYDMDAFFNTEYHLIAEARTRNTRQLILDLGTSIDKHCR